MTSLCLVDDTLFTASRDVDNALISWSLSSEQELPGKLLQSGHTAGISALCGNTDRIFSGGLNGELREWLLTEETTGCIFEGHFQEITSLAILADALFSGSRDATIRHWSLSTGQAVRTMSGHLSVVRDIAVDQTSFLSGSADGTVRLWDANTGQCTAVLLSQLGDSAVTGLTVSSTRPLFTACVDGAVRQFAL